MKLTRRHATLGLAAGLLTACGGAPRVGGGGASSSGGEVPLTPDLMPQANAGWDAWVASFKGRAASRGISSSTLDTAFRGAGFLPGVVSRDRNQAEFTRTLEDYLAIAANDERVSNGRARFAQHQSALSAIQSRFGVPANVVAAVWGMESNYGNRKGLIPVVSSTSTLAYDGRRGDFFESQLLAALRILQNGDTSPANMTGSWAGAMGHTQFIPTTYQAYAVDFTGDGRRDIWSADPTDSLASTANHFAENGWRAGQPWGMEVRLPPGLSGIGRGNRRATGEWNAAGVRTLGGQPLPDHGAAAILVPQPGGPAFVTWRNFEVIGRYNNAVNYMIGVGHLSDRIAGGGPLQAAFPPDANGLTLNDRKALQAGLNRAGFDAGTPDGVVGDNTTSAIEAYERANGLAVTGTPSRALLARLG
ncbi:lytic murein transglycosylase [Pelagovum pacificum]|uniref:Lytic murein transglycosylase n=1 Tax=Pelagovum pacificum TaxID=2588711 RepID=A0A5C5GCV6_9RHOB|nr:lytic murein transglycosylase [Pelagovum pacificum]QQA44385.1 lytic murein transglycosylase [Pelagovum pacificum]TNY32498.1 lytic murein transglycosylase [Pelagovum pacificum]